MLQTSKAINNRGIGLGLCITKQICERFDGQISVSSTYGKGATFTVSFKLEEPYIYQGQILEEIHEETHRIDD